MVEQDRSPAIELDQEKFRMTNAVEMVDVKFSYRRPRTEVFRRLSLSFSPNDITCILGHNGAGKTTLLKLIYGTLRQESGAVRIDSSRIADYSEIFLLSEKFGVNQELSLRQNLTFQCKLRQREVDQVIAHPYVQDFKLRRELDKPTGNLSSGYFMRANIVAGLVFQPSLVMLDEPTNSIDPATRSLLLSTLKKQKENGVTMLIVTHDLDFAYTLGDRLVVIDEGEVVIDDNQPRNASLEDFQERYLRFTEQADD